MFLQFGTSVKIILKKRIIYLHTVVLKQLLVGFNTMYYIVMGTNLRLIFICVLLINQLYKLEKCASDWQYTV